MKDTTAASYLFDHDLGAIAGNLPTSKSAGPSTVPLTELRRLSHPPSLAPSATSAATQRDVVLKAWAILLHLYLVADTVAFVVDDGTNRRQLAHSYWPVRGSRDPTFATNPQLSFTLFETEQRHQVNTAVAFGEIKDIDDSLSYVFQLSTDSNTLLRLYTRPVRVPHKFASGLWNTLLEIHLGLSDPVPRDWKNMSISTTDVVELRAFLPETPFDSRVTVYDLWRESVRTAPLALAIESWDGNLTYAELDRLSKKVAVQLISKGVRPGSYVPFAFEKGLWMVVAMLGIITAGAVCVPIDPQQPKTRVEDIVNQTKADIILVSPLHATRLADVARDVLSVSKDSCGTDPGKDILNSRLLRVRPQDPAVCIFTSGSTGKPKGIVVQHQALATRLLVDGGALGFRGARCLQFAAAAFDIFITDILTTLTHQGCLCIPSEEDRLYNLPEFCTNHEVSLAIITPSLANMLTPESFPTLRTLVFSGEALRADVVARWSSMSQVSLYQGYGPAETGSCTIGRIGQHAENLGHTLGNYICVLVDPENHNRLVPLGAVGELMVAGSGLLQEYIHDPVKTNAVLVDSPPWCSDLGIDQTKFFKTGDLLRYSIDTLDGSLEFVGRRDGQVKYHGQRIEVGEVEHHLSLFPNVVSCMVTLAKGGHLEGQLVGVVQLKGHANSNHRNTALAIQRNMEFDTEKIAKFLSSRVPRYMVPNKLFVVEGMPLNASMKMDRNAVNKWISDMLSGITAEPMETYDLSNTSRLLPHESTARAIAKMYAIIVAGGDDTRRQQFEDQDFNLQSGGIDSIQIMSLSMAIKKEFGIQIPMTQILSSKLTIRTVASIIDLSGGSEHRKAETPLLASKQDDNTASLPSRISQSEIPYLDTEVGCVFLTGATGYLGIELLRQLLEHTACQIYTLVRGSSEEAARHYLVQKAIVATWWRDDYSSRLNIWLGDLSQVQLGLNSAQWLLLQGQGPQGVDVIIHNGAKVHYHMDYDSLQAANVSSTIQLLQAVSERERPLHSFVFVSGGQQLSFDAGADASNLQQALQGTGYARSKATSELIVSGFAKQGNTKAKHVKIIKPGFIIGDAKRGNANQSDFIWRYLAASADMGIYDKETAKGWLFVADVGKVSEVILRSIFHPEDQLLVKILDGIQFRDLWLLLQDEMGCIIRPVDRQQWLSKLHENIAVKQEKHIMFPLIHMFETEGQPLGVANGPERPNDGIKEALRVNINQLIESGYLEMPGFPPTPSSSFEDTEKPYQDAYDVQSIRTAFPALNDGIVAFNNAAGTAVFQGAIEGTKNYMSAFPIEVGLDDPRSQKKTEAWSKRTAALATFMNADPDEIAFGQSTTMLLRILGQALRPALNSDCEIIVSNLEHEASAAAWISLAKDLGIAIKWWAPPAGDDPQISSATLRPLLTPKTRIVVCNHVSNVVGTIHPIRDIADTVHSIPGAILIVDGVAWAPHRPIDVKALDVDFYCFSWYKVFGPHIGQLYGRRNVQRRMLTGISHFFLSEYQGLNWRLMLGSPSFELEAGLVAITEYLAQVGWEKMIAQETVLQDVLLSYLLRQPSVFRVFGEKSSDPQKRVPVITFKVIGRCSRGVMNHINRKARFRIVSGSCWAPRPTHDVLRLDEDGLIRVSFVHYNTVEEVKEFCKVLEGVLDSA